MYLHINSSIQFLRFSEKSREQSRFPTTNLANNSNQRTTGDVDINAVWKTKTVPKKVAIFTMKLAPSRLRYSKSCLMTGYPSHLDSWRLPALIPRRETCLWTIYIARNISTTFRFLSVLATKAPNYILRHWKGRNPRGFLESTLQCLGNRFCYIHCCCRHLSILTSFFFFFMQENLPPP